MDRKLRLLFIIILLLAVCLFANVMVKRERMHGTYAVGVSEVV